MKCWHRTFLQTTDMLHLHVSFVSLLQHISKQNSSGYMYVGWLYQSGGDGGGVTAQQNSCQAPEPPSAFHFNQQNQVISLTVSTFSSCVCGNKTRHFKPKHDLFLTLTKGFLCLKPTRPWPRRCHSRKLQPSRKNKMLDMCLSVICRNVQCQHLFWRFCFSFQAVSGRLRGNCCFMILKTISFFYL